MAKIMRSHFTLSNIKSNFKSGLTVALISIPLAISLAVVSGVSPVAGIITAVWAGGVAAIFGGSNFNVIAPTGALAGIIATFVLNKGVSSVPMLAIIVGIFILIAYVLKLERYLIYVPSSVVHGFIVGIAAIISLNQINFALGLRNVPAHERLFDRVLESFSHMSQIYWPAFALFVLFFVSLMLLRRFFPAIPGIILMAPMGIAIGYAISNGVFPFELESLGSKFGQIQATLFQWPSFYFDKQLVLTGAVVAFISIMETMLAAKIADAMTKTKHDQRKEMRGAGLANMASGLMGGFPVTAALALTTSNIRAGATSRISALISSILIALISFICLPYFSYIPMAAIAGILVFVAYRMIEQEHIAQLWRRDKAHFGIVFLVAAITVYEDPTIGILAGSVIALLILVNQLTQSFAHVAIHSVPANISNASARNTLVYTIKGKLVYLNGQAHIARFQSNLKEFSSIILVLNDLYYVDSDGVDAIDEIIEFIELRAQKICIVRPNAQIEDLMRMSHLYQKLQKTGLVFDSVAQAMNAV